MSRNRARTPARRGIVDPRLSRYASATRPFIVVTIAFGVVSALLLIAQAWLLAHLIAGAFAGQDLPGLEPSLLLLLVVMVARAAIAWATELTAARSSLLAKQQLRAQLLRHVAALTPRGLATQGTGELATLATRGIDALDAYFSLYLPQLMLAVIVPVAVIIVMLTQDWISALIIALTVPLIPVFMALVGASTRERNDAQLRILERLAAHFLDAVSGLPTLKVFGRAKPQTEVIREVSERQRSAAMATLRVTFLSSLILELLATISVALVAVAAGLRLLNGDLGLQTALFVLVLAPEAYVPLRQLGANFHASAEGVTAAEQAFEVLETPAPVHGTRIGVPDVTRAGISVEELAVHYRGRDRPALDGLWMTVEPGEIVALTGPSGSGKSTFLHVLLGFVPPTVGSVRVGDCDLSELDPDAWRRQIAWVPQRPHLFAASVAENIRLGREDASESDVRAAARAAGLGSALARHPAGLDTILGDRGAGLSVGERQRVALARAFLREAPLLLLDEPTANLDGATEAEILTSLQQLLEGRTAVVVAHRPALIALADRVVDLSEAQVPA